MRIWKKLGIAIVLILATVPARAHPHVWVTVKSVVLFDAENKAIGIRHVWTFDEMYSSFAVEGLGKKDVKNPTREDLKELADLNIQSLKEFDYFTFPMHAGAKLPLGAPKDYYLEHVDKLLSLHFTLPLEKPLDVVPEGLSFTVFDQTYYIAFVFAKEEPLKLGEGAPKPCSAEIKPPAAAEAAPQTATQDKPGDQAKQDRLAQAFSQAMGADANLSQHSDNAVVRCKPAG